MNPQTAQTYPPYPAYKDSGVDWLGEIPEGWEAVPLAALGRFSKGGGFSKSDLSLNGFPAVLYGDIYTKYNVSFKNAFRKVSRDVAKGTKQIKDGDLLFAGSGETIEDIGKCIAYLGNEIVFAGGDIIIQSIKKGNALFISYVMNSWKAKGEVAKTAKGEIIVHTYASKLKGIKIPLPPLSEQTAIARFLEEKCTQLDRAVAQKQRMMALLQERKQVLIQQAVTRGLDPRVPMKDSGVDWIGQVPAHWEVRRVGFFSKVGNGSTPNRGVMRYWSDNEFPWLNSSKVNQEFIDASDQFVTAKAISECHLPIIEKGTILMAITGEGKTRGMVAICNIKATINQHLAYISINSAAVKNTFLLKVFQAMYTFLRAESSGKGSTKGAITCESIRQLKVAIPSIDEQHAIVAHIEAQSEKIDRAVALQAAQVGKLQEYKATLIDSAVRGRIKVY